LLLSIALRVGEFCGDDSVIATADFNKLQAGLLGPLKLWLANDRSFRDPNAIADTLKAVRDTLR